MKRRQENFKTLNQPTLSPWTSTAPVTSKKLLSMNAKEPQENSSAAFTVRMSNKENQENASSFVTSLEEKNFEGIKEPPLNLGQSSSQFFHFVRLMQLFPNVHPATLHTVMNLCNNDFFVAVDRLLYAKRCKELYHNRKSSSISDTSKSNNNRYVPYTCPSASFSQQGMTKAAMAVKTDAKKLVTSSRIRNKSNNGNISHVAMMANENVTGNGSGLGCAPFNCMDVSQFTLQCNVPLRPLSPVSPQDLSAGNFHSVNVFSKIK